MCHSKYYLRPTGPQTLLESHRLGPRKSGSADTGQILWTCFISCPIPPPFFRCIQYIYLSRPGGGVPHQHVGNLVEEALWNLGSSRALDELCRKSPADHLRSLFTRHLRSLPHPTPPPLPRKHTSRPPSQAGCIGLFADIAPMVAIPQIPSNMCSAECLGP